VRHSAPATLRKRPAGDRVQGVTERRSHVVWHNLSNLTVGIRCIQETINHPLLGQNDYPCNQARFCAVPDSGSGPRHLRMISHRPSKGQALLLNPCRGVAGSKKKTATTFRQGGDDQGKKRSPCNHLHRDCVQKIVLNMQHHEVGST
jgi:hypothetical protein